MELPFHPAPLETLARWIFGALDAGGPVLGIPRENLQVPPARLGSLLQGKPLAAPLGLAAGPHTQLAQNIAAGWLCGARFIELKTVQVQDRIAVPRPCIDSADETYNCEWSQELRLEQSFTEYLKAWVLVHALAARLGLPGPGALFAMSVGYDLPGIQSAPVQRFIASMRDAREALPEAIEAVARAWAPARGLSVPHQISDLVTLSTMHGCPPAEIERIARSLLVDLGLHTWVKLNPTLLGPERVRALLRGFDVEVPDAAFAHDPVFEDVVAMAERLADTARRAGRQFGLKLSNTLEVVNRRPTFPGEKTSYLSGRALHPVTLALAQRMAEALGRRVPISFCGGADAWSFAGLVRSGLGPVTVCTDLLKPGGYARLQQYLMNLEAALDIAGSADLDGFVRGPPPGLAEQAASEPRYAARSRPLHFKGTRPLGAFDCVQAPCQEACPVRQDVPGYLRAVAQGNPSQALEVVLRANPLPAVTGSICDHPCTERCVRNHYDAPLAIREVKRFAAEEGRAPAPARAATLGVRVAIVGAGPAGLAAAEWLTRAGLTPEIFEARSGPGGMAGGVIPAYRMDGRALESDLARLGVIFHFGRALGEGLTLESLRRDFAAVFLGVGAQQGKRLGVPGDGAAIDALDFLSRVRAGTAPPLGRRVLVIGGGNSAMDAARTARRIAPSAEVSIVYRRTRAQMPADPGEVRDALDEGVHLRELLAPARFVEAGLACTRMTLGPRENGRQRPVPVPGSEEVLPADAVIAAVGQEPRLGFVAAERNRDGTLAVDPETGETSVRGLFAGGDVVRGPSSIVQAVADGQRAAREIARRHGAVPPPAVPPRLDPTLLARKASLSAPQPVPALPLSQRSGFAEVALAFDAQAAAAEASRCLECDKLCSLCVTVCPNRANLAFTTASLRLELPRLVSRGGRLAAESAPPFAVAQAVQIVNLADFCNECGNCETFCPTAGAPWREKPRFWLSRKGFASARGDAFRVERVPDLLAIDARIGGRNHRLERRGGSAEYRSDQVIAHFEPSTWRLLDHAPAAPLAEGEAIDLTPCAILIALLAAGAALP